MTDWELIQQYAESRSEAAFAELVQRHLAWVYSVACRQLGEPHSAEDVVQAVFALLARKAGSLRPGTVLSGWLFRTTRFVASRHYRAELRRIKRDQIIYSMTAATTASAGDDASWELLAPHLDQAVASLSESDRAAILLRFYERKPLREIGLSLGISEEAAKKRVSRAIDKLRAVLSRRGVALGAAAAMVVLTGKTVQAAPVDLAQTVVKTAIGASSSAALPPLAQETLRAWRWAKIKVIAAAGAVSTVALLAIIQAGGFFAGHSPNSLVAENPLAAKALQTQTAAATISSSPVVSSNRQPLKKIGAITGTVLDDQDHPVAGALVWGGFSFEPFARDITDRFGRFALDKTGAANWVTIQADGFAADQQEFDPTNGPRTLVFHLSRVSPLKIRIVDEAGHGLSGISLSLYRWWGTRGTLAQDLPQETDAEGRLEWLSAPKGELELEFCKLGYRCSRTNKFSADAVEHVIVMHPEADVRGAVVDADTGAAVSAFTCTQGHSQPYVPSDSPMWDLHGKSGSNGLYQITIIEEQRPYLRIEAQGYETLETAIDLTNETQAVRDFRLTPQTAAHSIRGNVFLPNGSPATNVEVALCTDQVGVWLRGTAFDPEAFGNVNRSQRIAYRRKTDAQGVFSFDPKPGAHTLYSVSPAGLGQVRCFDFSNPLKIHLQPWGRIEGTVRTRDGNWGGRTVQWDALGKLTSWMTLYCRPEAFTARSDETGAFVLEHVPSGVCRVSVGGVLSPAINVSPGETAHVQVGGVGRPVVGKFIAPPDTPIRSWPTQANLAKAYTEADYDMPANLSGSAAERWKLEFQESPAGQTYQRNQYNYDLNVEADGSFVLPEVLPGKYRLFVIVQQGNLGSGSDASPHRYSDGSQIAQGAINFTMPDSPSDTSTMNLGDINLHSTR